MATDKGCTQRILRRTNVSARQSWDLSEWCSQIGGDEFTLACLSVAGAKESNHEVFASLQPFLRGAALRDTVHCIKKRVRLWSLTSESLVVLRGLLPDGIFSYPAEADDQAWIEDFTIYRKGKMLLGVVSHEEAACLSLLDSEWRQFSELKIPTHEPAT